MVGLLKLSIQHSRPCLPEKLPAVRLYGAGCLLSHPSGNPGICASVFPGMQTMLCTAALFGFGYDLYNTALALLRKNKDFQEIEESIRELRQEFANASITLLQENLSDAVARVLDSTNADEILLERIERLRQRITSLHTKRKRTHIRLQKAFPTRIEAISRINAERLFSIINERRKKRTGSKWVLT